MSRLSVPTVVPIKPMRLREDYRDYYGDAHACLCEMFDRLQEVGCYEPRIFHAPDTQTENAGIPVDGYLEYMLALPPGSFIVGFLHGCPAIVQPFSDNAPAVSSFTLQITDIERDYKLFGKPVPDSYLLPDRPVGLPIYNFNPSGPLVQLNVPRLLTAPYPVAPPGVFRIEFWNQAPAGAFTPDEPTNAAPNPFCRLSLAVAVPNPDQED
jgi:hypothetical protein